jgi:protein-S-isoprenylcysteine O-methyltransferase Ste14
VHAVKVIDIVIGVGWVVFWVIWLAAAFGAKAGRGRLGQFAGVRVAVVLLVLLLLRLGVLRGHGGFEGHVTATSDPLLQGIGLALFVLGLALAMWARFYIGRNWGMPMTQRADPELVRTGPYKTIRHPIYSGIILAMIGTTLAVSLYWLIAVVLVGAYFVVSAVVEERNMARLFPDAYPDYKRSTKMLVPFVF